ncbi:ABC transporter permease [Methanomethylovorans sp.]|uniref:ABC transporter permease n=1 Tax=Methanomethylovorans sp. TaxID=2758717 RepID=UPI000B310A3F|nr:ABC transporter permease [Methanomethylovorans sp.]
MDKNKVYPKKVMTIARKEYSGLLLEKTFILSLLVQLFIASFSAFLVVGLTSFYDPMALQGMQMKESKIGVIGDTDGELFKLMKISDLEPIKYDDFGEAYSDFYERKIDAIMNIPNEMAEGTGLINLDIYIPRSELKATIVSLQLKKPLEKFEQSVRTIRTARLEGYTPLDIQIMRWDQGTSSSKLEFIYVALLPLLMFTPAFISGGLVIDMITEEFERKTLELLLVSPVSLLDVIYGKTLVATAISPVQSLAWMLLLGLNGIRINNFTGILLIVVIVSLTLVIAGSIIAVLCKERGTSQLFYSLVLILLFMSSYLYTNSPLNLVSRLALDSIGYMEAFTWIAGYTCLAVLLLWALASIVEKEHMKV